MTFKEVVQELRKASTTVRSILLKDALFIYPFLGEAIDMLGFQRIESLHYSQKRIKDELLKLADTSSEEKIFRKLNYEVGSFHRNREIKTDLGKAFDSLGYNQRTPKATDIVRYYKVNPHKKRINGKLVEGYLIIGPLF